jgi:uncharacterized protein (TIGR02145 family)
MKKLVFVLLVILIASCGNNSEQLNKIQSELDSIKITNQNLSKKLDSITIDKSDTAKNKISADKSIKASSRETVTDYDGNVYSTVKIGNQVWMKENLKTTHYRDGSPIPNVTDNNAWKNLKTGAYCNYNNNPSYGSIYGRLYNWYAVIDNRGLAPKGWHVPKDAELKTLEMTLGIPQTEADWAGWRGKNKGGKLKETGTTHWNSPNTGATNSSDFTALPGGCRDIGGIFNDVVSYGDWWSSSEYNTGTAWHREMGCNNSAISRSYIYKAYGCSVRCIKD